MNNQEAFDIAAIAMLKQGERSLSRGGTCMYRGVDGLKCAVGHLIPDELYDEEMEDKLVSFLLEEFPPVEAFLSGVETALLDKLQQVHDHARLDEWEYELERIARTFELDTTKVDAFITASLDATKENKS